MLPQPKYNGFANRDTWLVAYWINNDNTNYRFFFNKYTKRKIMAMNKKQLVPTLRRYLKTKDRIIFGLVRVTEIKNYLRKGYL